MNFSIEHIQTGTVIAEFTHYGYAELLLQGLKEEASLYKINVLNRYEVLGEGVSAYVMAANAQQAMDQAAAEVGVHAEFLTAVVA